MRMGYRFDGQRLTHAPVDYYRMFYCDTAIQGNTPALMCAYDSSARPRPLCHGCAIGQPARRASVPRDHRGGARDGRGREQQTEDLRGQRTTAVSPTGRGVRGGFATRALRSWSPAGWARESSIGADEGAADEFHDLLPRDAHSAPVTGRVFIIISRTDSMTVEPAAGEWQPSRANRGGSRECPSSDATLSA